MAKKEKDIRFSKFGTVSFTGITKVNDFIDYLEQGKLMGTRCKKTGRCFFPPRADCYETLSNDVEWFEITGAGKLVTYSTLTFAPVGFENDLPYTIAVVDYGDYKVFGRIDKAVAEEELSVGMDLHAVVKTLEGGQLTYVFEKA